MACFRNSSRFCVRAQEKLCQILINNNTNNNYSLNSNLIKTNFINYNQQSCRKLITVVSSSPSSVSSSQQVTKQSLRSSSTSTKSNVITAATASSSGISRNDYNCNNGNNINLYNIQSPTVSSSSHGIINATGVRNYSSKTKIKAQKSQSEVLQKSSNKIQNTSPSALTIASQYPQSIREYSSVHGTHQPGPVREIQVDPYLLLDDDLKYFYDDIRKLLIQGTNQPELETIASYYFDGQGKALRPMVTLLMARAVNYHMNTESSTLLSRQRKVAIFSEMVHSASLVHDDVIDQSDFRRGKPSVNALWNHKKVAMAGDFILSIASVVIARLKHDDVTIYLSQILTDLVQGEFMQLGSKETENERFAHYLTKTYRKTASLIANALKSVAVLAGADDSLSELAFQYGRNIGLAFQLVDDLLDFVSSTEAMGKPTATDLKLGLATAPVLFACEKYPELNPMIMRRFQEPGDVERAFELVHKSQGLEQTRFLARKHCIEAIRLAQEMTESPYQKGLIVVSDLVINRMK